MRMLCLLPVATLLEEQDSDDTGEEVDNVEDEGN